jgi:hypothetical protein
MDPESLSPDKAPSLGIEESKLMNDEEEQKMSQS